jgi:hypothetical protein
MEQCEATSSHVTSENNDDDLSLSSCKSVSSCDNEAAAVDESSVMLTQQQQQQSLLPATRILPFTSAALPSSLQVCGTGTVPELHPAVPSSPCTVAVARYRLLADGDVQVCRLNYTRTVISKIMNSRYLRRWEAHHMILGNTDIYSATPTGFMDQCIAYSSISDVHVVSRWDAGHKYCIRVTVADGSLLLQARCSEVRDQWMHSIQWKRCVARYEELLHADNTIDVIVSEIKQLVQTCVTSPLIENTTQQLSSDLISLLFHQSVSCLPVDEQCQVVSALCPLLESNHQPTQQMMDFFTRHCWNPHQSHIVLELFQPVVHRILKHNVDFGRHARKRTFVQDFIVSISRQSNSAEHIKQFVHRMHGTVRCCPHPRVLSNLVAVCLSFICMFYERVDRSVELFSSAIQLCFSGILFGQAL